MYNMTEHETREFIRDLCAYTERVTEEIHAGIKSELAAVSLRTSQESGLHCLFENRKHAKELADCLEKKITHEHTAASSLSARA